MILDVGCGKHPLKVKNAFHLDVSKQAICLEMLADAHNLPFRNSTFEIVRANMVLEHLRNPFSALTEFARVSPKLIIRVQDGRRKWIDSPYHLFSWNRETLSNLLSQIYPEVEVYSKNRFRGARYLFLFPFIRDSILEAYCCQ